MYLLGLVTALVPVPCLVAAALDSPAQLQSDKDVELNDRYIVTLKPNVDPFEHLDYVQDLHLKHKRGSNPAFDGITHRYNLTGLHGYAAHLHPSLASHISDHADTLHIEPDTTYYAAGLEEQRLSGYGLNLISHSSISQPYSYVYDETSGVGTFAYVLDTGIKTSHVDFGGRASFGYNAISTRDNNDDDDSGHGTHIAGLIGSQHFGVAKRCRLIAVKCLNAESRGRLSEVLEGYQWAVDDIIDRKRQGSAVVNIAIFGPLSKTFNRAIGRAFGEGVTTVVAAGNDGGNAKRLSPSGSEFAITVSATDSKRRRAGFANYGSIVDLYAPGVHIESTTAAGRWSSGFVSGTSQAAAYVSGLVLYFKAMKDLPDAWETRGYLMKNTLMLATGSSGRKYPFAYNRSGH